MVNNKVEPEGTRGDLMEALEGAASHKPITNPTTGRTTVYLQASTTACIMRVDTGQRLAHTLHPILGR